MKLTRMALTRPVTVLMMVLTLLVLGFISVTRLKINFLPDVDFPVIVVNVPYPNALPTQVEREIAKPLEEVLATLGDVHEIGSNSDSQGCWVWVEFEFGRPVDVMRMDVRERIDQVRADLPSDVRDIFLFTFNSNDIPIMVGRISAKNRDLAGSYELLERKIIKPLERIEGVGRVQIDGIAPREVTIYLKMDAIKAHQIDVNRVFRELNSNNINLSVGKVTTAGMRYNLRTVGAYKTAEEIANLRISGQGLVLADIADVVEREPDANWYRRLNGEPAIAFEIQKASGAYIVDVSRAVQRALDRAAEDPALAGIDLVLFFDQADEILESLNGLLVSGVVGSLLAVFVLFFFLRHVRTTIVVATAIPFSIMATCVFLYLSGKTLNLLTMMGLMLAVGMLVDNAIVVLESIYRHQLRGERGNSASESGAREVGVAVTASTLTSVIVFAPIVLGGGDQIVVWLREVGLTLSVTLLFSLLISLTLVPLMAARLRAPKAGEPSRVVAALQARYIRVLRWTTSEHPVLTLLLILALIPATIGMTKLSGFGMDTFGERGFRTNRLMVRLRFHDNVNVYKADEYVKNVEDYLLTKSDSLGAEVYSFFMDNLGQVTLFFDHRLREREIRDLRDMFREELPEQAGVTYMLGDDDAPNMGAQTLRVSLFGEDSDMLAELSVEAKRRMALVHDVHDVRTNVEQGREEVHVIVNREKASRFGVNPNGIAGILNLTFRGVDLREMQADDREVPIGILLTPEDRKSLEHLRVMTIGIQDGRPVTLEQVADFQFKHAPTNIHREQQRTSISILGTYEGEEFGDAREEMAELMSTMVLPAGYAWSFGREDRRVAQEQNEMFLNIQLALACVYFVMAALFESFLHPLVIMLTVPFAIFGVIWLMALTNTPMNIMAMIGVVVLIGVIVNNGIVLISHVNTFRRRGLPLHDAIIEAGRERFRPILMTAATTVLGLLPLALSDTAMSDAQYYPMARALIGGLLSGTALTLIVLPTFYVLEERLLDYARGIWSRSGHVHVNRPSGLVAAVSRLRRRRHLPASGD
ncbi:MAG: efflux RND transporter permease subunit [Candidatus Latescibacterota bacterium]|nr:MAG: efflux RND transporter permease subunit [Candidatus Latescibacterota bacterium]